MKKFLVGIVIIIIASIGFNLKPDKRDQAVVVQEEPVVKKEEVITYKELLEYLDIFKTGDIINIENTNYLSSYAIPGRWKHTIFYLGTYQQFSQVFTPEDKYYEEINKHYKNQDEVLVLDSNSTGVKIRTFDQMANLKEESYLKALSGYRFNEDDNFIKTYLSRALDYLGTPYDIEVTKTSSIVEHVVITPTDLSDFLETLEDIDHVYLLEKEDNWINDAIND